MLNSLNMDSKIIKACADFSASPPVVKMAITASSLTIRVIKDKILEILDRTR